MSKILILDDSPTDTYLAKKCAEILFSEVRTVSTADGLFKELLDFEPSVVLLDWHLDEPRNGISIIGEIRDGEQQNSAVPIVVVSSRRMPADKQNAMNAGASDYIVKPISVESLAAAVSKLIPQFEIPQGVAAPNTPD